MENSGLESSAQKSSSLPDRIFPWKKAWQTLKAIWPQLVYISILSMSIPQYLLFYISTGKASEAGRAFQINQPISFENSLAVLSDFGGQYLSLGLLVAILFLIGCFTAVALCIQDMRSEPIEIGKALKSSVRSLLPQGALFILMILLLSLLSLNIFIHLFPAQLIRLLGLIACVLLSAMPVFMTLESRRPWKAFKKAMSMDYIEATGMSKWSVFFLLLTYELLALNVVALVEFLSSYVSEIDSYFDLSRETVFSVTNGFPFGKLVWVTEAIYAVGFAFTTMAFIVLNATFIYELHRRNTLGRNISIEV